MSRESDVPVHVVEAVTPQTSKDIHANTFNTAFSLHDKVVNLDA